MTTTLILGIVSKRYIALTPKELSVQQGQPILIHETSYNQGDHTWWTKITTKMGDKERTGLVPFECVKWDPGVLQSCIDEKGIVS